MDFLKIAQNRQSCRNYDGTREIEKDKLERILEAARLSPSACNSQPYHITVCTGDIGKKVANATTGMGMNKFTTDVPVMIVLSEEKYSMSANLGARIKGNDYRSIDIGILSAYITSQAVSEGLSTCILGWFDGNEICKICGISGAVRLVIALGYAKSDDMLREKKRKPIKELVTFMNS